MTADELRNAYQQFFMKSDAGKHFVDEMNRIIARHHEEAEASPELSRDYVQRARGARDVSSHITSVIAERSKSK